MTIKQRFLVPTLVLVAVGGLTVFMFHITSAGLSYTLLVGPNRTNDRYTLEVRYPGTPGNQVVRTFTNLDPSQYTGKVLIVKPTGALTSTIPPTTSFASTSVDSRFDSMNSNFPMYYLTLPGAWGDYDNDGDIDLPLYGNDRTAFGEIPGFRTLLNDANYHGGSWCDYDKDGDLDFVILGYNLDANTSFKTRLFRNDGNGVFTDVAPALGMDVMSRGETAVWGDFNGDGWPDLFTPYHDHNIPGMVNRSFLYMNNQNGTFTETAEAAGVSLITTSNPVEDRPEGADAVDWDKDGDLDLYTASHLFINDGSAHFTDVAASVGLPERFDEGASFVDYDNDNDFDLYVRYGVGNAVMNGAHLWRNDNGHFTDVTTTAGIGTSTLFWGDAWADVDNNGYLDLLQLEYNWDGAPPTNKLLLNNGSGTFQSTSISQVIHGMLSWADVDNDGDMDFVDAYGPWGIDLNRLKNDINYQGSSLTVRVLDDQGRTVEHRATVRLRRTTPALNPLDQTRAVGAGATYLSQNQYDVHFGLGMGGTVQRNPLSDSYPQSTNVILTAVPMPGYHFVEWVGDWKGTANPTSLRMTSNKNVRAVFNKN